MNNETNSGDNLSQNNNMNQAVPSSEPNLVPNEQPVPNAEPIPNGQAMPNVEPIPNGQAMPNVEPIPNGQAVPSTEPNLVPNEKPMPNIEPTPNGQAMPNIEPSTVIPNLQSLDSTGAFSVNKESIMPNDNTAYGMEKVDITEKKKKNKLLFIILAIILLIAGMVGFYFIYNNPTKVFNNAIDFVTGKATSALKESDYDKSLNDLRLKFNTNAEGFDQLASYTYGIKGGLDSDDKKLEGKLYMVDQNNKEYSFSGYVKADKIYALLSSYDKLIYWDNVDNSDLGEIFDGISKTKSDDSIYLVNFISSSLKKNLNKKNFSRSYSSMVVNGKKVSAFKNSYVMDEKDNSRIVKAIWNDISNDKKALKIVLNMTGLKKAELDELYDKDSSDVEKTTYSIYTDLFGNIVGYDTENKDNNNFSYYKNKDDFSIVSDNIFVDGVKKNGKLEVTVKRDKKQIGTLSFDKLSENEVVFNYNISSESNQGYKGKVNYKKNTKNNEISGVLNISVDDGSNTYEFNFDFVSKKNAKIADIDESQAVKLTDQEKEKVLQDFFTSLSKTPLGGLFGMMGNSQEIDYSSY